MADSGAQGRILALDLGKKRIGLALSDALGLTAQPLETLVRTRIREDLDALARLMDERGVGLVLLGNPLHMSGDESRQTGWVREFGERLAVRTGRRVEYRDERWTSLEAERLLRMHGRMPDRRTGAVDKLAAALLLQSYLDQRGAA
jgi:putative Holliday junction resolvase